MSHEVRATNEICSVNRTRGMFLFKNYGEIEARRLVLDLLFFKKAIYEVKVSGLQFSFNIF